MGNRGGMLAGTIGHGVMRTPDDGRRSWRNAGRELGEVSPVLWVPQS